MASSADPGASKVRIFLPENRLGKVLSENTGRTAAELSADSRARVAAMAAELRTRLQDQVARLTALRAAGEAAMLSRCDELAALAMDIAELAGAADRSHLGEAARGILAMLDSKASDGLWHKKALDVHIDALTVLCAARPPKGDEAEAMLTNLAEMRRFVGVSEAGAPPRSGDRGAGSSDEAGH